MPSIDDVYRKFGEVSEAAQLLETELGNLLIENGATEADLFERLDPVGASDLVEKINRQTLGQLIRNASKDTGSLEQLETLLNLALQSRNRLSYSFYRQHNFRRNSDQGRELMHNDLASIHGSLLEAYKAVVRMSGIDLDTIAIDQMPTRHVPI